MLTLIYSLAPSLLAPKVPKKPDFITLRSAMESLEDNSKEAMEVHATDCIELGIDRMEPTEDVPEQSAGCYSVDADLSVVVEGEIVLAHSQVLICVSPVFKDLLALPGKLELKNKRKNEFETFWNVLTWQAEVTKDNAMFLSMWADEYQIDGLRNRCEDILLEHMPCTCLALEHATTYHMPRLEAKYTDTICTTVRPYLSELTSMGENVSPELILKIWPGICKAANMDVSMPSGVNPGHALWPFVVKAATYIPLEIAKQCPDKLYEVLPRGADHTAKHCLLDVLKQFET